MNIYVACPKNYATGGVELLHQVVYFLNTYNDINAYIYYVGSGIINKDNPHPADYIKYNNPYVTNIEYKEPSDTIIVPEIYVNNLFDESLKLFRKVIYWESVDNYFGHIRSIYRMKFPENCIHMAQSYYALDFLENIAKADDIIYVTDYLNDSYFDKNTIIDKKKQVLYNPAKGLEFTKKIINKASDIEFIPIKDLNREQVKELMKSSMVYIDFGNHPGKDRMPRESCISGCCIITGRNGSADFKKDVNIPDEYKFYREDENIDKIIEKIRYILDNYDTCNRDFEEYRKGIRQECFDFRTGITHLVNRLTEEK